MDFSDSQTISTDLRSDISFMNRQKELRTLYSEFKEALDAVNSMSINQMLLESDQESPHLEEEDYDEEKKENDIELIIQQIEIIMKETDYIFSLLSKPKYSQNKRVQKMKKQLKFLKAVNINLKKRAEMLLE